MRGQLRDDPVVPPGARAGCPVPLRLRGEGGPLVRPGEPDGGPEPDVARPRPRHLVRPDRALGPALALHGRPAAEGPGPGGARADADSDARGRGLPPESAGPLRLWTEWADAEAAPADWPYREALARWEPAPPRALDLGRRVRLALLARAEEAVAASGMAARPALAPRPLPTMMPPTVPSRAPERPGRRRGRRAAMVGPEPVLSFLDPAKEWAPDVRPVPRRRRALCPRPPGGATSTARHGADRRASARGASRGAG